MSNGDARAALFERLPDTAAEPDRIRAELEAIGSAATAPLPCPQPAAAFLANALRNGGTADTAGNRAEVVDKVARYIYGQFRSHKLVAGNDPRLAALPWRNAGLLPRFGTAEDGDPVALAYARVAVAETGAVVTYSGRANPAANMLLPESYIVLVDAADVVETLEQGWTRIDADAAREGRPRAIHFVAGPSATADIEMQLVQGAHGPRRWHVILVGGDAALALATARATTGILATN